MVTMAQENGTDVILGKTAGIGGRSAPKSMVRRSLFEQHGMRFATHPFARHTRTSNNPAQHARGTRTVRVHGMSQSSSTSRFVITVRATSRPRLVKSPLPG